MKKLPLLTLLLLAASCIRPVDLTCEYVHDPMAVDCFQPRLSWINTPVPHSRCGEFQTAYRIRVASTREGLENPDLWDTGKVESDRSTLVRYNGTALQSTADYWWQVQVWDARGRKSRWSKPAYWGAGIMGQDEWKAEWIGGCGQNAPLLRKSFKVSKKLTSAKAYVTGLGLYQFYVNGAKVGDYELTPNETNWEYADDSGKGGIPVDRSKFRNFRILYNCYDIKPLLNEGENVMGAILGNGFYNTATRWVKSTGTPKFIGQIYLKYEDGSVETICSDGSWMTHDSPITIDGLFEGESYNANLEIDDWCRPGTDLTDWNPVVVRESSEAELKAHYYVNDKVMERLKPVSIEKQDDAYLVDFGDYITGWVRMKHLNGEKGDSLRLQYLCEEKGNGPALYVLDGSGDEEYAPRFTWFAFDKVLIKGFPGELTADNLVAEAVYSDIATTGHFSCSNELFNRINRIWWRSQTDNMHLGTASDCPHREKGPYTGDGEVSCVTVMHNFDAAAFYSKWLNDMSDCQNTETGYVPNGAPWHIGCGGGPLWGAAMNIIPWEFYRQYGDRDILEKHYFAMCEQVRYLTGWVNSEGTVVQGALANGQPYYWMNLGEWLPPFGYPDTEFIHSYALWKCADCTAKAAEVLGKSEEAFYYRSLADRTTKAIHRKFYDPETHSYGDFGSNAIALSMGVPEECREAVVESLRKEMESHDGHLDTGILGTKLLFEVLAENGLNELAFEAMNKKDFPSFGWWLEQGAYTTWERWDGGDSRNHPMFGGALTWFYRKVAGMEVDEQQPGYRHIIFRPMPCGDLTYAEYFTRTPYGEAGIKWNRSTADDRLEVEILVPVGCTATLTLPDGYVQDFGSGRHNI